MKHIWKVITGAALAAALTIAPLATVGAVADDPSPDETTTAVLEEAAVDQASPPAEADAAAAEPASEPAAEPASEPAPEPASEPAPEPAPQPVSDVTTSDPAEPAGAATESANPPAAQAPQGAARAAAGTTGADDQPNEGVCAGTHITPQGDVASLVITAPEGFLISEVCVKAGSINQGDGPEVTVYDPPVSEVTLMHSSGKDISHYSVTYVPIYPVVVTLAVPDVQDECGTEADMYVLPADSAGVVYSRDGLDIVATIAAGNVVENVPDGWVEQEDGTFRFAFDAQLFTDEPCTEAPTAMVRLECSAGGALIVTLDNPNDEPVDVMVAIDEDLDGDADVSESHSITPGETVLTYNFEEGVTVGLTVMFGETVLYDDEVEIDCEGVVPIPVLFNAAPIPPTCGSAGALPDILSQVFPHVTLSFNRPFDGPGVYILTATAHDGFDFGGGTTEISREITVAPQLSEEECGLIPGDIGAVCVGDVPFLGYELTLPEGFETDDPTPVTITFVNPDGEDYVLENQPLSGSMLWPGASDVEPLQWPGWVLENGVYVQTDGNFAWTRAGVTVIFEVNPTYETVVAYPAATEACANPENPSTPPNGTPTGTPGTPLAVTGSSDLTPWGVGGAAALAAGFALLLARRFARR